MRSLALCCLAAGLAAPGCQSTRTGDVIDQVSADLSCTIPADQIVSGGPGLDGIPALHDPPFVTAGDPGAGYLRDHDRVIGLLVGDAALAIPLNILWWHEVVNLDLEAGELAVTHCPLTGSSLVFDRGVIGNRTFGVSGLLFRNNLLMYDRDEPFSLWPQMLRGARCGRKAGANLAMVPSVEMTWAGWRALHPGTRVVSSSTGFSRDYQLYPYGTYDREDNTRLLFPMSIDTRRPPKERVLGIPGAVAGGWAVPFGVLRAAGSPAVIPLSLDGRPVVVFWDGASQSAVVFDAWLGGRTLVFQVQDGTIVDDGGSAWRTDGLATSGPLTGERLTPLPDAFVAYWFAWAAFYPEAGLVLGEGT